jgi:hypothetical protein
MSAAFATPARATTANAATAPIADEVIDEIIDDDGGAASGPRARTCEPAAAPDDGATLRLDASERLTWFVDRGAGGGGDRFESRTVLFVGARSAPRARDPWRLEVRTDLLGRAPTGLAEVRAHAWDLEARPWEAWWRTKPSATSTLTLGYQPITWGVLDAGAAADVFASYDLRLGPAFTPAEVRMPLPAARLVWSPSARVDLELVALPFFTPHRFDVTGTRYAAVAPAAFGLLTRAFDAGTLARVTAPVARANGVDANPAHGEAGARATWRTSAADIAFTAAWARSRFPSFRTSEALRSAIATGSAAAALRLQQELEAGATPLEAVHDGYVQLALDAQGAAAGVPWGVEVGISSKRNLVPAASLEASEIPRAHVAQAGARASKAFGDFVVTGQLAAYTLVGASGAGAVPVAAIAFGTEPTLAMTLLALRYEHEPWLVEASGLGLCAGPRTDERAGCTSAAGLATARVTYAHESITVSLAGTGLARTDSGAVPFAGPLDQVALRVDWAPAR